MAVFSHFAHRAMGKQQASPKTAKTTKKAVTKKVAAAYVEKKPHGRANITGTLPEVHSALLPLPAGARRCQTKKVSYLPDGTPRPTRFFWSKSGPAAPGQEWGETIYFAWEEDIFSYMVLARKAGLSVAGLVPDEDAEGSTYASALRALAGEESSEEEEGSDAASE